LLVILLGCHERSRAALGVAPVNSTLDLSNSPHQRRGALGISFAHGCVKLLG
jgi:hypothetical protein